MKLKHIYSLLFIALLGFMMTGCDDDDSITLLDEIQVSSSYVAIPQTGGSQTITVTAKDSWKIKEVEKEVEKTDEETDETITETIIVFDIPEWLTLSATSGNAGESEITFSAESTLDGRTAEIEIKSGGKTLFVNVIQGESEIEEVTVAVAKAGPDGKTYRVTGVCTEIQNTEFGNWILEDETGWILVYGTLDEKGNSRNFLSLNIEVGDEVTIEGPRGSYAGDPQFVDVMVLKLEKSKVAIDEVENEVLPLEGGIFSAHLTVKGEGLSVDIPEDAKDWLSIASIESEGEEITVNFQAAPNTGGDRQTTIIFRTKDEDGKNYSAETVLKQKGAIVEVTMAEFLAAEVGDTQYRLTGVVTEIENTQYGNIYLKDFSGEVYVYGVEDFKVDDFKVGDIITIVGKRAAFREDPQVGDAVLEKVISVTPISIAEALAKPDSKTDYYMITGEIIEIENDFHGNVFLKEDESEIYLRGLYPGYGAYDDFTKNVIVDKGLKVGDEITVITTKGSFNGVPQLDNGIYFSHESAD